MLLQVHSARYPTVDLGAEFSGADRPSLQVCYLQHALGAGEHYNSVAPVDISLDDTPPSDMHSTLTVTAQG